MRRKIDLDAILEEARREAEDETRPHGRASQSEISDLLAKKRGARRRPRR